MLVHPQFNPVALAIGPVQIHWCGLTYLVAFGLFFAAGAGARASRGMLATAGVEHRSKTCCSGDKNSDWLRLEVELKAKHTHIPFDAILNPSDYFINLYPCLKICLNTMIKSNQESNT